MVRYEWRLPALKTTEFVNVPGYADFLLLELPKLAWQSNFNQHQNPCRNAPSKSLLAPGGHHEDSMSSQIHVTPFSSRPALWIWLLLWTIFSIHMTGIATAARLYLVYIIEHCLAHDSTMSGVGTSRSSLNLTMAVWSGCRATSIEEDLLRPTHSQHFPSYRVYCPCFCILVRLYFWGRLKKCP